MNAVFVIAFLAGFAITLTAARRHPPSQPTPGDES